jgi:hypothetical protein
LDRKSKWNDYIKKLKYSQIFVIQSIFAKFFQELLRHNFIRLLIFLLY